MHIHVRTYRAQQGVVTNIPSAFSRVVWTSSKHWHGSWCRQCLTEWSPVQPALAHSLLSACWCLWRSWRLLVHPDQGQSGGEPQDTSHVASEETSLSLRGARKGEGKMYGWNNCVIAKGGRRHREVPLWHLLFRRSLFSQILQIWKRFQKLF